MGGLLKLIQKLYGKNALAKTIGTRTNVIRLPDNEIKKFTKRELNIEAASDAAAEKAYKDMEQLIPDIPKMNDQEKLIFEGNLRRLDNKLNPPSAEVIEFGTKKPVSPTGIAQLETELGIPSDVDPSSPLGQIMMRTKQIQKEGKDLAKEFGMEDQLKKGLDDLAQTQIQMSKMQDEGLVRATAREIMDRDIKSGKLKLPKEEMDVVVEYSSVNDPLDIWRKYYGEDALEQLDSMVPDFYQMTSSSEAADAATKKFTFEPKAGRTKGSYTQEEMDKILSEEPPEEFATGGRVGFAAGTSLKYMIDFILKNARKVTKKVPSKQFLEKMAEVNPQNIVNAYEDVKKRAGIIDDPDVLMGQAPKTDIKKVRTKAKKDKEGIQELAKDKQIPVRDDTIVPEDVITVPEPFKGKYQQEFLAHDALYGRRSGDNKVDAEAIAETVADMQGKVYDDMGYSERMDLYDKAYGYLSLLDRTTGAMKEAKGRTLQAGGGLAYLMGL